MEQKLGSHVQSNQEAGLIEPPRPPAAASRRAKQEASEEGKRSQ